MENAFATRGRPIVLIGLMGSGKSTIGRELSRESGLPFLDMDAVIEEQTGKTIPEIFQEKGEHHFRVLETALLRYIETGVKSGHGAHIISTGGGVVLRPENREILRRLGFTVWLNVDLPNLLARTARAQNRPLLQVDDREAAIRTLLTERSPLYEQTAHLCIESSEMKVMEVVEMILHHASDFFSRPYREPVNFIDH